ncbi:flagellar basal-body MS-ring/collar protein FliF [Nocardioides sp. TF02-7]|uniref:flagellar basal-body MS-ring/collar protein FliF n=1 Tax=Nocardioides sp. TF02-7 TaxID=2917724 RepID=UPI001F066DC4|nr:flagellar basal-body MS-ring/collar protein FliF [Nocardioides sp. TF02-7]UMG92960.1 flagellar M-ring protein FliF [Nocardioides sp. TF02-7]
MRTTLTGLLTRARRTIATLTAGQRAIALVGAAALLVGAFLVVRWASTPSYAPLFSDLSGADASAVIEELDAQGIPYELSNGGSTIMVPRSDVYSTRIALSGQGLPAASDSGYSLLDDADLSTSEFKEQTDFKRAMEGELSSTIEAIDGVETAVVRLTLPEKEVFSDDQTEPTASVLVDTPQGSTLAADQVQAVVHLVASSVERLDPERVTVADATGTMLTDPEAGNGAGSTNVRASAVTEFQDRMEAEIQAVLDRVVGAGNAITDVTADLNFDTSVTDTRTYEVPDDDVPPLAESRSTETYSGPADAADGGGIVGPDGQMDPGAGGTGDDSAYENSEVTRDNAVNETRERREAAPGEVDSIHVGVVLDAARTATIDPDHVEELITAAIGIKPRRGDTIEVAAMPFDRSAEEAAAAEIAAAEAADARDRRNDILMAVAVFLGIALLVLLAWLQARRRTKRREEATTYVVEQLRAEAAARAAVEAPVPAVAALEAVEPDENAQLQDELRALVERQPEDVAALLRGWLVEPR